VDECKPLPSGSGSGNHDDKGGENPEEPDVTLVSAARGDGCTARIVYSTTAEAGPAILPFVTST